MSEGRADLVGKKFTFNREPIDEPDDRFFMSATNQKPLDLDLPLGPDRDAPDQRANFRKKPRPETANINTNPSPLTGTVHQSDSHLLLKLHPAKPAIDPKPTRPSQQPQSKFRDIHEQTTAENFGPPVKPEYKPLPVRD